jgi:Ca-activated chloride channel family protein
VFALLIDRRRARYPVAFTNLDLIATLMAGRRTQWRRWLTRMILLLALATAATALARPRAHFTVADQKTTVVILIDVSGSMHARDISPTRLDAAVAAIGDLLDRLPKQFKVGLVAFSNTPDVLQQPTHDRQLARQALGYLAPEAGTAIGDGLAAAVRVLTTSLTRDRINRPPGQDLPAAIVFLSDGAQNRGHLQPSQATALAHAAGIRVDTVALGTPTGNVTVGVGPFAKSFPVPPDPEVVRAIAQATGGRSFTARNADRLSSISDMLGSSIGRDTKLREITYWFAAAAAALLLVSLGLGRIWSTPLP